MRDDLDAITLSDDGAPTARSRSHPRAHIRRSLRCPAVPDTSRAFSPCWPAGASGVRRVVPFADADDVLEVLPSLLLYESVAGLAAFATLCDAHRWPRARGRRSAATARTRGALGGADRCERCAFRRRANRAVREGARAG
jgi:hypothetical protein